MKIKKHIIACVKPGSIGEELGLQPKDNLLAVNDTPVTDVFDYHYLMNEEYVELLIEKEDGEEWLLEVEKEYEEDLGIEFENGLMDEYRSCSNRCIFCFIDQMPPGMRETLYFKDDDSRLSFLQGNYVTLTNMKDEDLDRVIQYHLSPINISVHTTSPRLRCQMLHNRFAGDILEKIRRLYEAGIELNGQIVLCKGINDKEELERSLTDLSAFAPVMESVSVVPVGLTRFREGLYPLEPFTKEDAREVLETIHRFQKAMKEKWGIHFVHASDEWYILAGQELPSDDRYDGYPQYENGVGMLRLLEEEIREEMKKREGDSRKIKASIATGKLAAPFMESHIKRIQEKYPQVDIQVFPITNFYFGEEITVSGLITGKDLIEQLQRQKLGEKLLLPCNMLRSGEDVFLDDLTVAQLKEELKVPIVIVDTRGEDFVKAVLEPPRENAKLRRRQIYEQTNSGYCGKTECGEIHSV